MPPDDDDTGGPPIRLPNALKRDHSSDIESIKASILVCFFFGDKKNVKLILI